MSRDELVGVTYEVADELNKFKLEHGLFGRIDALCAVEDKHVRESKLRKLMLRFDTVGPSTICKKDEMNRPTRLIRFSPLRIVKEALAGRRKG